MLAGGAALFAAMMADVERLRMSLIDLAPEADTFFPSIDPAVWREVEHRVPPRLPADEASVAFVDYLRR